MRGIGSVTGEPSEPPPPHRPSAEGKRHGFQSLPNPKWPREFPNSQAPKSRIEPFLRKYQALIRNDYGIFLEARYSYVCRPPPPGLHVTTAPTYSPVRRGPGPAWM